MHQTSNNSTHLDLPSHEKIIESVALVLVLVVSSFLNTVTCVIIARNRLLRTRPANVFVANLCLANMMLTLFVVPFSLATLFWDKHDAYSGPSCTANGFFSVAACTAIVLTLCCISIDRYIAVNKSTRYRTILTPRRALYMLSFTWFQALLFASFPVLGWSHYEYNPGTLHCSPSFASSCSLHLFLSLAGFAIPIVVMLITYIRIFQVIRRHSRIVTSLKVMSRKPTLSQVKTLNGEGKELHRQNSQSFLLDCHTARKETLKRNDSCPLSPSSIITTNKEEQTSHCVTQGYVVMRDEFFEEMKSLGHLEAEPFHAHIVENGRTAVKTLDACIPSKSNENVRDVHDQSRSSIFQRLQSNLRIGKRDSERPMPKEYKIAKTGLLLLILFLILWLPYLVVNSCSTKVHAPDRVFHFAMWLVYMNGVANPVAYAFNNNIVKTKFKQMFRKAFHPFSK